MNKIKVLVLMSSFNGEKFIKNQVNSIFNQENCDVFLKVHDDCSTDNTYKILLRLKDKYKNIEILRNTKQLGFSRNFLNLISNTNSLSFEYIALSDQDDIFYRNKFINQANILSNASYVGCSSSVKCFDRSKKILNQSKNITKYDFLFEGAGQGCTFLLKKIFFDSVSIFIKQNHYLLKDFIFHDWLIYIYARANNFDWFFIDEPLVHYRIHENNSFGNKYSFKGIKNRLSKIFSGWYYNQIIIANQLGIFIDKNIPDLCKINYFQLLFILFSGGRRKITDRFICGVAFLLGRINGK
jgi:rhamnosyltransferase